LPHLLLSFCFPVELRRQQGSQKLEKVIYPSRASATTRLAEARESHLGPIRPFSVSSESCRQLGRVPHSQECSESVTFASQYLHGPCHGGREPSKLHPRRQGRLSPSWGFAIAEQRGGRTGVSCATQTAQTIIPGHQAPREGHWVERERRSRRITPCRETEASQSPRESCLLPAIYQWCINRAPFSESCQHEGIRISLE
jgi:hypothetical protein